ncbi:MAG: hypothetical protein H0V17_18170 [Deltaproteobacteria bacterium]|nr:hypothetical protein [Deltaproteobacteria bacterium]
MSRTVITAVVAVVIAVLTAIAFFVSNISLDDRVRKRADARLTRAYQVVQRLNQLANSDVQNKAERLAAKAEFVNAIKARTSSQTESANQARLGFQKFMAEEKTGTLKPDRIALIDGNGEVVAEHEVPSVAKQWKNEDPKEKNPTKLPTTIPAVNVVLDKRVIIADQWNDGKQVMRIGVAPVVDPEAPNIKDPENPVIIGAILVAYAQTGKSSQQDRALLGTDIAYFENKRVVASSFTRGGSDEDTAKAALLTALLQDGTLGESASKQKISLDGADYFAAAVKMPRSATKTLPDEYPANTTGAIVLAGVSEEEPTPGEVMEKAGTSLFILLLGGGSLALAMLGIYLTHRRLITQADQIEQGVTDIINGNLDRTFRPVGAELDGLANGLNVMLARVLGRPEPGEEEFDEAGNPIIPGRVDFDEGEEKPAPDPDLAALVQESEPDYYKRVYTEYLAARKATGAPEDVSFENFIAKLKVNEGKLRAQYQCRAVRFRVLTKDGKVSLKPVPIFA